MGGQDGRDHPEKPDDQQVENRCFDPPEKSQPDDRRARGRLRFPDFRDGGGLFGFLLSRFLEKGSAPGFFLDLNGRGFRTTIFRNFGLSARSDRLELPLDLVLRDRDFKRQGRRDGRHRLRQPYRRKRRECVFRIEEFFLRLSLRRRRKKRFQGD